MKFEKWTGARQRLPDRRGRGAAVGADPGADQADLRPAFRRRLRRDPAAAPDRGPGLRRRAADLQPRRLRGRALGQRRPRGGPLPAPQAGWTDADEFSILTKAGPITPTITSERTCTRSRWVSAQHDLGRLPLGTATTAGASCEAAGRDWAFQHVSIGNPQCAIEVGRRSSRPRPRPRSARRSKHHELFPNRTNVSFFSVDGEPRCERGSSSAGWGRRSPPAPAPVGRGGRRLPRAAPRAR